MKTTRIKRLCSQYQLHLKKESSLPTLSSSFSGNRSFKDEPCPGPIRRISVGRSFRFEADSDEDEDSNNAVVYEEEQGECQEKAKKILPHFKLISDRGEFSATRNRIKSERKADRHAQRCKSVESLKLPQVEEEKREEDQNNKMGLVSKLLQFKDQNEFNLKRVYSSSNCSHTDRSKQSIEINHFSRVIPQKIIENDAEETKSEKLYPQKSILTTELEKLIVDEIDNKKRRNQQLSIPVIYEEKVEYEGTDNLDMLRTSLGKLESQSEYLKQHRDQLFIGSDDESHKIRKGKSLMNHDVQMINEEKNL